MTQVEVPLSLPVTEDAAAEGNEGLPHPAAAARARKAQPYVASPPTPLLKVQDGHKYRGRPDDVASGDLPHRALKNRPPHQRRGCVAVPFSHVALPSRECPSHRSLKVPLLRQRHLHQLVGRHPQELLLQEVYAHRPTGADLLLPHRRRVVAQRPTAGKVELRRVGPLPEAEMGRAQLALGWRRADRLLTLQRVHGRAHRRPRAKAVAAAARMRTGLAHVGAQQCLNKGTGQTRWGRRERNARRQGPGRRAARGGAPTVDS